MIDFWRKCRTTFRWCRFTLWAVILLALCVLLWLNRVGLPDFLKSKLIASLRNEGVQLEFSRMRLSFTRGFVADNVRVGNAQTNRRPALTARQVQLQLNFPALLRRRVAVNGLIVRNGIFTIVNSPTNTLALTHLQTELQIQPNGAWTLNHFHADFGGATISISGEIAHAAEIRDWKFFSGAKNGAHKNEPSLIATPLQNLADILARMRFTSEPTLRLIISGDARDIHSISMRLDARATGVRAPWFSAQDLRLTAQLTAPDDAPTNYDASLAFWTNLFPFQLEWQARANGLRVKTLPADAVVLNGEWRAPRLTVQKVSAEIGSGELDARAGLNVLTRKLAFTNASSFDPHALADFLTKKARAQLEKILWTQPPSLRLGGFCTLPAWTNTAADWREIIAPTIHLNGDLSFSNAVIANTTLSFLRTHLDYQNQFWDLRDLELTEGRTHLFFNGDADEKTQNFNGHLRGALEAASALPFITASNLTRNYNRFTFHEPLNLDVTVQGNWRDWHSLALNGRAALTNFSCITFLTNRADVDFLRTQFNYTNQFWKVSELELAQGRTHLFFDGETSDATENFIGHLRGDFDLESLRPFLPTTKAVHIFDYFRSSKPVTFDVNGVGNWRHLDTLTATGRVALTDFFIRQQPADSASGDFLYTNRLLTFFHPHAERANGTQRLQADAVTLDFAKRRIYFTNGFSTADPMFVVRSIGPKTTEIIEPYQFPGPDWSVAVNGCSPMRDVHGGHDLDDADLTFTILKPTPFRWKKLRSPAMTGTIHWLAQRLFLTNITGKIYGGSGGGNAAFDFTPATHDCDFSFQLAVTNVNLHLLAADLSSPTNQLAGALSGDVAVTDASSDTWRSWNGHGNLQLHNGQLWNVPIFGLVSDGINLFVPGLGNSRATDAAANFTLTNGVIYSDSLVMHTLTMELNYSGTVDLEQNVNAHVTAQLLRNLPILGSLFSTILSPVGKIFECEVTGKLSDPKVTPIYVPTPFLAPLHPIRSVQEMFSTPSTNAP